MLQICNKTITEIDSCILLLSPSIENKIENIIVQSKDS
jgi:hypothetical protein